MSTLEFKLNISQEMNGVVYTCQSANEALQRSVHEAISLNVLCKYFLLLLLLFLSNKFFSTC